MPLTGRPPRAAALVSRWAPGAMSRFCNRCGLPCPPSSTRCRWCRHESLEVIQALRGLALDAATVGSALTEQQTARPGHTRLAIFQGPVSGSWDVRQPGVSIGRDPRNDVVLDDRSVSRRHATVMFDGESLVVRDQGSLNGVYHNAQLVDQATLFYGDQLQVGRFRLYCVPAVTPATRAATS